jgi:hypothetical protein
LTRNPYVTPAEEGETIIRLMNLLVGRAGLEPATNGLKVRCSTN